MASHRPSSRLLAVWRIRLLLLSMVPSFLCAAIFHQSIWWGVSTLFWVVVVLIFYYIYLPLRCQRLSWRVEEGWLRFHCGVLYDRYQAVPLQNIQFLSRSTPPLMRLYHLTTLVVHCAGGVLFLPGMSITQAVELQQSIEQAASIPMGGKGGVEG